MTDITDEQPPLYRVQLERSYDQRAKAIIAFNTCAGDLDDKLDAAWAACLASRPPVTAAREQEASATGAEINAALESAARIAEDYCITTPRHENRIAMDIRALKIDDGLCRSCMGDKCVTGPECVTLGKDL